MAPYEKFEPGETDIISIVDVDYYIDMETMMVEHFQPYLLYTLVPSRAAKDDGDYGYCFDRSGNVKYHVSGGGWYPSQLWNWDGDSVRVFKRTFGVVTQMACYALERRQVDPDHQVIMLIPLYRSTNMLTTWLLRDRVQARQLERFQPVQDGFVRFYVTTQQGRSVTTGLCDEYTSSVVPASIDAAIASAKRTVSGKLTLITVKSKMDGGGVTALKNHVGAEALLEFHLRGLPTRTNVSLVDSVRRFQWLPNGVEPEPDAKPGMTAFMLPLLDGGFVPDTTQGNEQRMVDKRVKEVTAKEQPLTPFLVKTVNEFCSFLIPDDVAGTLFPVDVEEVYARQPKPSQQMILRQAEHGQPKQVTQQFMKREAYGKVNNPRPISTINGVTKREFSRYVYAFTDHIMKPRPWYAFGKPPVAVAERVVGVCEKSNFVADADAHHMDGHHGNVLEFLERTAMGRSFGPDHKAKLYELMKQTHHLKAVTAFGIAYMTEYHRLSGVADTSSSNTMDTAFIAYLGYRLMGYSPEEAWQMLEEKGLFGGDDSMSGDLDSKAAKRAAQMVGQVWEVETIRRGELGVSFLARRYGPGVWYGDTNSCCDIKRQLAKFHLTVNLPSNVTPEKKLAEKSFSFSLTDSNTPIIGEFARRALELFPLKKEQFTNELKIWGVEMDASKQYPNERDDWMSDIVDTDLPDFDVPAFRDWLRRANRRTILCPPRFAESLPPNPKSGVVCVDGDIVVTTDGPGTVEEGGADSKGGTDAKPHFRARKPKPERSSRKTVTTDNNPSESRAWPREQKVPAVERKATK